MECRQAVHNKTDEPVGQCHNDERVEVVHDARNGLDFALERGVDGFLGQPGCVGKKAKAAAEFADFVGNGEQGRVGAARADGGDADVPRFELEVEGARHAADVGFGGVVRADAGHGHPGAHRRLIHDVAKSALFHAFGEENTHARDAIDVEIAHDGDAFGIGIGERRKEKDTSIVDKQVDFEAVFVAKSKALLGGFALGEIDSKGVNFDVEFGADFIGSLIQAGFVQIDANDMHAATGTFSRQGSPDARGSTGDKRTFRKLFFSHQGFHFFSSFSISCLILGGNSSSHLQ